MTEPHRLFERSLVDIEWPFNRVVPPLHCPVTGKIVKHGYDPQSDDVPDEPDYESVKTLKFLYLTDCGEFAYIESEFEAEVDELIRRIGDEAFEEEFESDRWELICGNIGKLAKTPFIYCFTTSGMACGPVSFTVYVGLDLALC